MAMADKLDPEAAGAGSAVLFLLSIAVSDSTLRFRDCFVSLALLGVALI
jgi:hypothetical protein